MAQSFNCPTCGAPLDYGGDGEATMRCPYCNNSIMVPDELRQKPSSPAPAGGDLSALVGQASHLKEIAVLARSDRKVEAIKLYRQLTGVGLKEAYDAVEAIAMGRPVTLSNVNTVLQTSAVVGGNEKAAAVQEIVRLIKAGQKIPAIKIYRETFGVGLAVAKEAVEAIENGLQGVSAPVQSVYSESSTSYPAPQPQPTRKSGCSTGIYSVGLIIFIVLVTVIPILAAMAARGGPLAGLWSRVNPVAFARNTLTFGGEGTGPGLFTDARGVAVDSNTGTIYVAEYEGGRVQVFDATGKFLTQWTAGDRKTIITGLAADRNGIVNVVVGGKIRRYEGATGKMLGTIDQAGGYDYFDDVAVTADGGLAAVVESENLVRFNHDGQLTQVITAAISTVSGDSELDTKIAVDGQGNIYALGSFNNAVFKFAPDGKFVTRFGSDGDEKGQFSAPYAIAVDNQSRVYVSDMKGIQVFSPDGRYLAVIDTDAFAYGITFSDKNELFVIGASEKVQRMTVVK